MPYYLTTAYKTETHSLTHTHTCTHTHTTKFSLEFSFLTPDVVVTPKGCLSTSHSSQLIAFGLAIIHVVFLWKGDKNMALNQHSNTPAYSDTHTNTHTHTHTHMHTHRMRTYTHTHMRACTHTRTHTRTHTHTHTFNRFMVLRAMIWDHSTLWRVADLHKSLQKTSFAGKGSRGIYWWWQAISFCSCECKQQGCQKVKWSGTVCLAVQGHGPQRGLLGGGPPLENLGKLEAKSLILGTFCSVRAVPKLPSQQACKTSQHWITSEM